MPTIPTKTTLLIDLLALLIVGYLAYRQFREKRAQVSRLWITPALALLFSYTSIQGDLFDTALSPAIIGGAFVVGAVVGALRGMTTKLTVDAPNAAIVVKGTPVSVALWVALLAVKGVADLALEGTGKASTPAGVAAGLVTATLLSFSLGALVATQVYYYWRYALAVA